jgi:hypothetical protein
MIDEIFPGFWNIVFFIQILTGRKYSCSRKRKPKKIVK